MNERACIRRARGQVSVGSKMSIDDIRALRGKQRRQCHDDITVTVVALSPAGAEALGMCAPSPAAARAWRGLRQYCTCTIL